MNKNAKILLIALVIPQCAFLLIQFVMSEQIEICVIAETVLVIIDMLVIFIWQVFAKKRPWVCLIGATLHLLCENLKIILFTSFSHDLEAQSILWRTVTFACV